MILTPTRATVVVADDHPVMRDGLRDILTQTHDFKIVGEAGDGETALDLVRRLSPDVLVLDIEMPRKNGLEVAEIIQEESLRVAIIILTMYHQESIFNRAMDLGVTGYVLKDSAGADIIRGIEAVLRGEYYISPALTKYAMRGRKMRVNSDGEGAGLTELSPMERKILDMIAASKSTHQIAEEMFLSPRTIEHHRSHICQKLNLSGSYALLRFALEYAREHPVK